MIMGIYEPEKLNSSLFTPKRSLSALSQAHTLSPEHMYTLTPPHHAVAAVPFRWEESPGKPKPCKTLAPVPIPSDFAPEKCLELPPRLLLVETRTKIPRRHPPATVFDVGRSSRLQCSSFKMVSGECYGSFRNGNCSPEMAPFLSWMGSRRAVEKKRSMGPWKWRGMKGKKDVGGGSYVFPNDGHGEESVKVTKITAVGSFTVVSQADRSHFWESIAEGLKQVVPWKNRREKEMGG